MAIHEPASELNDQALIVDRGLVDRVEHTLALDVAAVGAELGRLDPDGQAMASPLAGGQLVLLGPGMFVNRGLAMGLGVEVTADDLRALEAASRRVGVPAEVEVCPWADASLVEQTSARAYRPVWFRNAFARPLSPNDARSSPGGIAIDDVDDDTLTVWQDLASAGFGYSIADQRKVSDLFSAAAYRASGTTLFVARIDGQPVASASLSVRDGVATLGGMATIAEARQRGVQSALIRHRLAVARRAGCDIAVATATPAGASERNLRRHGFVTLYTQVCVRKADEPRSNL